MKVLQINSVCGKSSTGRIASDLASQIICQGGDSIICFGRGHAVGKSVSISFKVGTKLNVYIHTMIVRLFDFQEIASLFSSIRLCRFIKKYNPDIIHLHNIHGYYLNYGILFRFLKRFNKPIVWTLHDCWPFTGHCSHFEEVACAQWLCNCNNCPQKRRYPKSWLFDLSSLHFKQKKRLFTSIDAITLITPSEWLKRYVKQSFLGIYDVKVINNGIDKSIFRPIDDTKSLLSKYQLENIKVVLGVSSLWDRGKGLEDFIKLSSILPDEFRIVMIGTDARTRRVLPSSIIAIDRTNCPEELATWYSASYVFVNPTYEDNFPTVNIEAISCGTPVIGYETGGSVESIMASGGIVVKQGDVDALAFHIVNSQFGEEDRQNCLRVSSQYDVEIMYRKYMQVYNEKANRSNEESFDCVPVRHE